MRAWPGPGAGPNLQGAMPLPEPAAAASGSLPWRPFRMTPGWFRATAWAVHRVAWRMRLLEYGLSAVEKEVTTTVRMPWHLRPRLWLRGFLAHSHVLYRFDCNDPNDYLTDVQRFVGSRTINGPYAVLLDDKLVFDRLLADFADLKPRLFGVLEGPNVVPAHGPRPACPAIALRDLVRDQGKVAVKPILGGGGRGFAAVGCDADGGFRINGKAATPAAVDELGVPHGTKMVTEFIETHPCLAAPYRPAANTLRLLTVQDEQDRPFVARAVARFGCSSSGTTDNWSSGGLCAAIDMDTGLLSRAARFPAEQDCVTWHDRHPETGVPIAGLEVPHWHAIRRQIAGLAASFPYLPYVGWDLIVTQDGFRVLEGNAYSGVNMFQIHEPLLTDPRLLAFYRRKGVIRDVPGPSANRSAAARALPDPIERNRP